MDIFALASEAIEIEKKEKEEIAEEEAIEQAEKEYKLDIKRVLEAIAKKDYNFYDREIAPHEKHFAPFILNMWLSFISSEGLGRNKQEQKDYDELYRVLREGFNQKVNRFLFSLPKKTIFLLACSVPPYPINRLNIKWVSSEKKSTKLKVDSKVISMIQEELWDSREKIIDMIDNGLITAEMIKAIEYDLECMEKPVSKKKSSKSSGETATQKPTKKKNG